MKNLCTFVCLFAATTITSSGVVANKSVPLGVDPMNMRGDVVNSAGKSNRLTFMPVLPAAERRHKSDQTRAFPALFADTVTALGGIFDEVTGDPADGGQVVNRVDKVDRYGGAVLAQAVARNHKADPIRTTLSKRILAHYTSSRLGGNDTERVVSNVSGKTDRLSDVVLAQAVERGWKTDMMFTTVASLEPAPSSAVSTPGQAAARKSGAQTGVAEHRAPLVFVPVTLLYDRQANNLAEFTPENAATKTLWN